MADRKDFLNSDGEVNEEMLSALSVLPAGLGQITNGPPEGRKRSGIAARMIAALLEKERHKREEIDRQLFQAQHNKNHTH